MNNINQNSIKQQVLNLSPIQFKNMTSSNDDFYMVMTDEKTLYLQNMFDSSIINTKILKKPHNKILKRRLSEIDSNEKIIFRMKIFNSSCFCSKYQIYFGELTLNQDENGYFRLEIYKKNKQSTYIKDYDSVKTYVSII